MKDESEVLANMVRVGTVSSVDAGRRTARVLFEDLDNMVSGDLSILRFPGVRDAEQRAVSNWMPSVGDKVICLYLPVFNGGGAVLGVV